ncbi:MAG: thiamine pyrophosphate-binding protein [Gemmatimonadales bacterium]
MTTYSGAELVVKALEDEGVRFAFGIPGTHNIELYDALAESRTVRTVLITDEQSAGFMADAVWRSSGELACVNVVPGAGLTHALSGIAEAYLDGMPLLVLGCGIRRDTGHAFQLHDIDQLAIAAPVCKATFRPENGAELYRVIRQAAALAREGTPGPVMVEVSVNHYLFKHQVDRLEAPPAMPALEPSANAIGRAAALLTAPGARPLLYLGWGAARAGADLVRLAEALGAPVATTITGKGVFPESHPLFLWNGFGQAAPPFARQVAEGCTVTLAIGARFSEVGTGSYSCAPRGPLIHADINPTVFGRNYPATVTLEGDAAVTVARLLAAIGPRAAGPPTTGHQAELEATIRAGHAQVAADQLAAPSQHRVTPARLFRSLSSAFGPDTVYTTDSGNGTFLAMENLKLEGPGRLLAPVDYSCMGYSVPAAIGAKLARPDRPVVALPGDGAFLMTGLELLTAANQGAAIAVFVLRDRELAQIAQFQATAFGRKTASVLPDYDVAGLAEAVGIEWVRLDRDAELDEVVRYASEVTGQGRPIVVDTAIDYSRPSYFTRGVVKTNLGRLPLKDRLRFIARAIGRRLTS